MGGFSQAFGHVRLFSLVRRPFASMPAKKCHIRRGGQLDGPCADGLNPIVSRRYDTAADIWSFGITILELAQGHAPMARLAPLKVLVNTIKYPPPELPPDSSGKHFSKALREMASMCLNKDPSKRPTASKLLEHRFLKEAKKKEFIVSHLLEGTLTTHELPT